MPALYISLSPGEIIVDVVDHGPGQRQRAPHVFRNKEHLAAWIVTHVMKMESRDRPTIFRHGDGRYAPLALAVDHREEADPDVSVVECEILAGDRPGHLRARRIRRIMDALSADSETTEDIPF